MWFHVGNKHGEAVSIRSQLQDGGWEWKGHGGNHPANIRNQRVPYFGSKNYIKEDRNIWKGIHLHGSQTILLILIFPNLIN